MHKFGFIGVGNMGGAIAAAICKKIGGENVIVSDINEEKAEKMVSMFGCRKGTAEYVAQNSQYIVLGVKPQVMKTTAYSIKNILRCRKDSFVVVSMAAGVEIKSYEEFFGEDTKIIRIMPNLPVMLGFGATVYSSNKNVTEEEKLYFVSAMEKSGVILEIDEKLINAASALSGSGPAFVYMFAENLAESGVKCGLSREIALQLATQTIIGAGYMMERSEKEPGQLKDDVCSPGGSTIEGVKSLEENGFKNVIFEAVEKTYLKNFKLGK